MTYDHIKDGTLRAASPKNYRCVDLTVMHICEKFERNPSRNVACRVHTRFPPKNMTFDPIKDRTLGAALPKTIGV